jgi:hypothetical protein
MIRDLAELIERAAAWPKRAQEQLVQAGQEIEAAQDGAYEATPDELMAIDEADAAGVASNEEIEAVLKKFHPA